MDEAEWLTRKKRIDTRLARIGWKVVRFSPQLHLSSLDKIAVEELPTANGPADYALFVGGQCLGIVEAKKVTVNPQNVLEQAKRYARGVFDAVGQWNEFRVPFLYASNGTLVWYLDTRPEKLVSRQLSEFHTPDALGARFAHETAASKSYLLNTPIEQIGRLRPYQRDCIVAVEAAITSGKHDMMVAMATGTGKTYLTVAQVYRLLESKLVRRILFLVDRKALAAQAVREFNAFNTPKGNKFTQEYEVYSQRFQKEDFGDDAPFDPKVLPNEYLTGPKSSHTFVYISTIQRMARNLFGAEGSFAQTDGDPDVEEDADRLDIPIHAFDLIIADECHRGYSAQETSIWRNTLQHFDAVRIGLTATPAAHTVALFGEPVFRYGVEQGIREGFLVDYDQVAIHSNVRLNGVFLKVGEQIGKIDPETGGEALDNVEDEREFDASAVEREITAPESNRKIIQEIAKHAYEHEQETGRFPKILIFAVNDLPHTSHADQLVRICRDLFAQGDDFVQKITGNPNVDRPLQRIREFRNRPNPKIVVTVDMLSTGVDIPALEFIVFLRPVKSRILWEQMLGRGTRRCDDINKSKFVVFDCFDGTLFRYFKDVSNFEIEEPRSDPLTISEIIENIWQNIDRKYHVNVLVKRLHRIDKAMSADGREEFGKWIPDGNVAKFAMALSKQLREYFDETMKLLRNPDFQELLINYPRAKHFVWVGYDVKDEVTSRLPRGTFTPYSQGVKANVIFFQKGRPTEHVWIFDARSNVPGITKKDRPLTAQHFAEFADCYGKDPNGLSKRKDLGETGRFRKFYLNEIKERGYKLDVTWLKDDSLEDADELPEPQDLAAEAITELEAVVDDLREIVALVGKGRRRGEMKPTTKKTAPAHRIGLSGYAPFLGAVKNRIRAAQVKATLSANAELIRLYWDIGRAIAAMQKKEGWGAGVIPRLSRDIANDMPEVKGFSERNLKRMVQFAAEYPGLRSIGPTALAQSTAGTVGGVIGPMALAQLEAPAISPQAAAKLGAGTFSPTPLAKSSSSEIVQTLSAKLAAPDERVNLQQLVARLPWAHNVLLLQKVKDLRARLWYVQQTITYGWSHSVLALQIKSAAHTRSGKAVHNFHATLPPPQSDLAEQVLKDPYIFDFLTLAEPFRERELELALLDQVQKFLLELGQGFAFVGRQYHLEVGTDDFYLDLIFYHLRLRCFVVVDLKRGPFKAEYAGKMNFYCNVVDDRLRHADDKPTIGLILCQDKNRIIAEYALKGMKKAIGVSEYELTRQSILQKAFAGDYCRWGVAPYLSYLIRYGHDERMIQHE